MEHYIKVDNYTFDPAFPNKLTVTIYFDVKEGDDTTPNHRGFYADLQFKSVSIDTEQTFICTSEPSSLATTITDIQIGSQRTERYAYYDGANYSFSARRCYDIELDLTDTNLNGVLSTLQTFDNTLLFFFVEVEGMEEIDADGNPTGNRLDYNAVNGSYIWEQPKMTMFTLYNPVSLHNLIFENMLSSMDLDCCSCVDCASANNVIFLSGLESALHIGKWQDAIKFWKLLHDVRFVSSSRGCNCH